MYSKLLVLDLLLIAGKQLDKFNSKFGKMEVLELILNCA
jgi:hypothetical protein